MSLHYVHMEIQTRYSFIYSKVFFFHKGKNVEYIKNSCCTYMYKMYSVAVKLQESFFNNKMLMIFINTKELLNNDFQE